MWGVKVSKMHRATMRLLRIVILGGLFLPLTAIACSRLLLPEPLAGGPSGSPYSPAGQWADDDSLAVPGDCLTPHLRLAIRNPFHARSSFAL